MTDVPVPEKIEVEGGATVTLTWDDGTTSEFAAAELRAACQCASCREPAGEEATRMVGRIRQDEEVHVEYLRTVLSELRVLHFKALDGRPGTDFLDPLWQTLLHWHAVENPRLARDQQRQLARERILEHPNGEEILEAFLALETGGEPERRQTQGGPAPRLLHEVLGACEAQEEGLERRMRRNPEAGAGR